MKLKEFIEKFVECNTLIRLWYPIKGGHASAFDKSPKMEHELIKGEFADHEVIGVTDILVPGHYVEAVNIVIEENSRPIRRGHKRMEIKNSGDYQGVVDDMLTEFLESFQEKEGLAREPTQDDFDHFGHDEIGWIYTQKGMRLYDTACRRYSELGLKIFDEEIDCYSSGMLMP